MADAWGGAWGDSWGVSWQASEVIPEPIIVIGRTRRIDRPLGEMTARLDVTEKPDICEASAVIEFNPVTIDNDFLLVAA